MTIDPVDFCRHCGARIPPLFGEGTCVRCDPEGVAANAQRTSNPLLDRLQSKHRDDFDVIAKVRGELDEHWDTVIDLFDATVEIERLTAEKQKDWDDYVEKSGQYLIRAQKAEAERDRLRDVVSRAIAAYMEPGSPAERLRNVVLVLHEALAGASVETTVILGDAHGNDDPVKYPPSETSERCPEYVGFAEPRYCKRAAGHSGEHDFE